MCKARVHAARLPSTLNVSRRLYVDEKSTYEHETKTILLGVSRIYAFRLVACAFIMIRVHPYNYDTR